MTVPGAEFGEVGPQRLDRIEDDEVGPLAVGERREDVLDIGFGRELDRRVGRAEPLRAQPDLGDRLLAGDIDDAVALRPARRGLHQQRRLADAGIAADQQRRAAHEAAAGRPVEFGDAGGDARGVLDLARQRGQRDGPALRGERSAAGPAPMPPAVPSSTSVFHSPQASHLPAQRDVTLPQVWQMNWVRGLARMQRST